MALEYRDNMVIASWQRYRFFRYERYGGNFLQRKGCSKSLLRTLKGFPKIPAHAKMCALYWLLPLDN